MRALLIGNYGVGNVGDDALKEYFLQRFSVVQWTITGIDVPRFPFGIRSLFAPWWKTIAALHRSDAVVFGGGTLFTDIESVKACVLWWWHAFFAHLFGKKIILAFQGVGPFRTRLGGWCARWVIRRATHISVRDDASFARVRRWRSDVILSFDPVFSLLQATSYQLPATRSTLIIIPRDNSTPEFFRLAEELWKSGRFHDRTILSFKRGEVFPLALEPIPIVSIESLISACISASFILTQRYHGAVAALAMGIPFEALGQGSGDKHSTVPKSAEGLRERVLTGETALRLALGL